MKINDLYTYVKHENREFLYTYQTGGVDSNEGILLSSIGYYSLTNLEYNIDYDMVKAINSAYQDGQSRKRCKKIGLATYRVARGTNRPHPRPTVRDEDIGKHQYYNQKSNQSHMYNWKQSVLRHHRATMQFSLENQNTNHYLKLLVPAVTW